MDTELDPAKLLSSFQSGGVVLALSTAIMLAVRLFRSDSVQNQIPEKYRWGNLPIYVRWGFIFGTSTLASTFEAVASGKTWGQASAQAALAAFGAVFLNKETKVLGSKYDSSQLKKDPAYMPSPLRKRLNILAPMSPIYFKPSGLKEVPANSDGPK